MTQSFDEKTKQLTDTALKVCDNLAGYKIETTEKYELAVADLKAAKELLKAVDAREKEITAPLNQGLKRARDFFRPAKNRLQAIIDKINSEMFSFRRAQEAEAKKKEEELAASAPEEELFTPEVKPDIPKTDAKVRKNYKYELLDLTKVDGKFLQINDKLVSELVRKLHEQAEEIVGKGSIRVYFEETTY